MEGWMTLGQIARMIGVTTTGFRLRLKFYDDIESHNVGQARFLNVNDLRNTHPELLRKRWRRPESCTGATP